MSDDKNLERERLLQTSRDWAAATAGGHFECALAYWTDDAVVLPPDQPAVVGKAEIRAFVQHAASNPGFSISWEPELVDVSDGGDMGYMVERNRVTFTDASGSLQTQQRQGRDDLAQAARRHLEVRGRHLERQPPRDGL